jgi:hypothetical protein
MRVPVAVYRWFEKGGAWAYHPDLAQPPHRLTPDQLDVLFDAHLKAPRGWQCDTLRQGRLCCFYAMERDAESLDPRARPGETFILRVAFLPGPPTKEATPRLHDALLRFSPTRPGEDASLSLEVDEGALGPGSRWGCGVFALLLAALVAGMV